MPVVRVEVDDGVGVVTMNRPEARNALNRELRARVPEALRELDRRDDVRALVLTGADPAFCAGLDLRELSDASPPSGGPEGSSALPFADLGKPLIGAVNGAAVTGGLEYALCCDFLIASERARFADTHARVNVMPGWGMTVLLPQAVGVRRAKQMSFSGNFIDAQTALTWGLVNRVVPHAELLSVATELARDIASVRPDSLAEIKRVYADVGDASGNKAALSRERQHNRDWFARFDPRELAADREAIEARGRRQAGR